MTTRAAPDTNLAVFTAEGGFAVEVRIEDQTIWLTQKQMAKLFAVDARTVNEHLSNIYQTEELQEDATLRNFRTVQMEGSRRVARDTKHFNLDAILSVG